MTALACSPWASLSAVSGHKQVTLFNTQTAEVLGVLPYPEGQPHILKFSRTGDLLLVGGEARWSDGESGRLRRQDRRAEDRGRRRVRRRPRGGHQPQSAAHRAGGPAKKILRVYSTATGELLFEQKKHTDWVTAIEFSPDGVLLASGDRANGVLVWESDTGKEFYQPRRAPGRSTT